jgi:16S rRNA U516 pseudouridylate synthase RsuA-like enzyme
MDGTRLNKFLAQCGIGSRRKCDELIQAGRVEINGSPCLNMGTRVLPTDHVRVDGKRVAAKDTLVWPSTSRAASSALARMNWAATPFTRCCR